MTTEKIRSEPISISEADDYIIDRSKAIVTDMANVLFLIRKNRSLFGEVPELIAQELHYTDCLQHMIALGIPNARDALQRALRPIKPGAASRRLAQGWAVEH